MCRLVIHARTTQQTETMPRSRVPRSGYSRPDKLHLHCAIPRGRPGTRQFPVGHSSCLRPRYVGRRRIHPMRQSFPKENPEILQPVHIRIGCESGHRRKPSVHPATATLAVQRDRGPTAPHTSLTNEPTYRITYTHTHKHTHSRTHSPTEKHILRTDLRNVRTWPPGGAASGRPPSRGLAVARQRSALSAAVLYRHGSRCSHGCLAVGIDSNDNTHSNNCYDGDNSRSNDSNKNKDGRPESVSVSCPTTATLLRSCGGRGGKAGEEYWAGTR